MNNKNCMKASSEREGQQPKMDTTGLTRKDNMKLFPPVSRKRPACSKKDVPWVWVGGPSKPVRKDTPWAEADRVRKANRIADPWFELTRDKDGMELVKNMQKTVGSVISAREKRFNKLVDFALSPEDGPGKTEVDNDITAAALKRSGAPASRPATSRRVSAEAPLSACGQEPAFLGAVTSLAHSRRIRPPTSGPLNAWQRTTDEAREQTPVSTIDLKKELEDFEAAEQKVQRRKDREVQGSKTGRRRMC